MKKVFVSGCYDILHAGHIQFFNDAKALGDHLTVCFASDKVLLLAKKRKSSIPEDHKRLLLMSLSMIDQVLVSSDHDPVLDFKTHLKREKPHILAVTEDDRNVEIKKKLCETLGIELVVLSKRTSVKQASTTSILASIRNLKELPLRVDFAGGWLDVPKFSKKGAYVVNCAISPLVSLDKWPYQKGAGLGGSAAYTMLKAQEGVLSELDMGVGWQDPAIISQTGLCVWRSGTKPVLDVQFNPDWLEGKMLIVWTGSGHLSVGHVNAKRDFGLIRKAGAAARKAVLAKSIRMLAKAVSMSYQVQLGEGMQPLPAIKGSLARKYLGAGHGGYALYLFASQKSRDAASKDVAESMKIEPYMKQPI